MRLDWWLALSPVLLIILLMIVFRWGAHQAGPAGWQAAVAIAAFGFGAGPRLLVIAQGEALVLTIDVLLIVWAAILLYRVTDEAGAISALGAALTRLTDDRGMQALILAWPFASFLQGIRGFGVPVAVTAPILVGLGFPPLSAVILPTIGHSWAVTFGSLASSFQAMIAATGLPGMALAPASAGLLGVIGLACGLSVAFAAGGWGGISRLLVPVLALSLAMGGMQYLLATHHLWTIGSFGAGLAGLAVGVPLASWQARRSRRTAGRLADRRQLVVTLAGYLVLVLIILLAQTVAPVARLLGRVVISIPFPATQTAHGFATPAGLVRDISVFGHIGVVLGYATLAACLVYGGAGLYPPGAPGRILRQTGTLLLPASVGILSMIAMAQVMQLSGMIDRLAVGQAARGGEHGQDGRPGRGDPARLGRGHRHAPGPGEPDRLGAPAARVGLMPGLMLARLNRRRRPAVMYNGARE